MESKLAINLSPNHDEVEILARLRRVLDPELDQSVLELGFITSIDSKGHNDPVSVSMKMPTAWCSPNFAYMMAEDVRRELLKVASVQQVKVCLENNVVSAAIEAGVNAGQTFEEAFEGETFDGLAKLRGVFLRKGYVKRQEALMKRLLAADFTYDEVCTLRVGDIFEQHELCEVVFPDGRVVDIDPPVVARDYLERRALIGLDCAPDSPLFLNVKGEALSGPDIEEYLIYMRTIRVSMQANGSLCSALLAATNANEAKISAG